MSFLLLLQGLINLKNYDERLYVNVDDLAVWASDLLYRKAWSNEYCSAMTSSSIFPRYFTFTLIFCWLSNSLKQTVCQGSEIKCSFDMFLLFISYFYSYYTFSLRETNDFVLTSLKAATQIPPPIALEVFTQNMCFILKCLMNPHKRYSNIASTVPFVIFWNLANESFSRKKIFYWSR